MPAIFASPYARWLTQHGEERAQGVNVLEFLHPAFGSIFVSSYGEAFAAKTETGADFVADPLGFMVDRAADNLSTEQRFTFRLDNANGLVTQQLRALDEEDLQTPVALVLRLYLDTHRDAPAFDPVQLFVTKISATRLVVECEASADELPNVTAGIRYTFELFPPLVYL